MNFKKEDGNSVCTCSWVMEVNIVSYKKLKREEKTSRNNRTHQVYFNKIIALIWTSVINWHIPLFNFSTQIWWSNTHISQSFSSFNRTITCKFIKCYKYTEN